MTDMFEESTRTEKNSGQLSGFFFFFFFFFVAMSTGFNQHNASFYGQTELQEVTGCHHVKAVIERI